MIQKLQLGETKTYIPRRNLCKNIHSNVIHSSQKLETIQMYINNECINTGLPWWFTPNSGMWV